MRIAILVLLSLLLVSMAHATAPGTPFDATDLLTEEGFTVADEIGGEVATMLPKVAMLNDGSLVYIRKDAGTYTECDGWVATFTRYKYELVSVLDGETTVLATIEDRCTVTTQEVFKPLGVMFDPLRGILRIGYQVTSSVAPWWQGVPTSPRLMKVAGFPRLRFIPQGGPIETHLTVRGF